jgi:hypothetical protein
MPMHPNPMADTSRLLFPSFRFCTVSPRWGGPRGPARVYPPYSNDSSGPPVCAFPILPIFCLILSGFLILCTAGLGVVGYMTCLDSNE